MEDDLSKIKEDDLGKNGVMKDTRVSQEPRKEPTETIKEDKEAPEVPDSMQENQEDSLSTPLLDKELEEASTRDGYEDKPTLLHEASNCTIRAISNPAITENNRKMEDNPFGTRQPRDITVNGISLMSIMKNKRRESVRNSPMVKKTVKGTKAKPGTATPPVAKITNYFEMIGRENIDKKKTFSEVASNMKKKIIEEKIRNFEAFQNGGGGNECVMSGGRCVNHKVKLTREVTARRVSSINQLGEVTWLRREGTILVCPRAVQQSGSDDVTHPGRGVTSNKKQCITDNGNDERITASNTADEDLLLDSEVF